MFFTLTTFACLQQVFGGLINYGMWDNFMNNPRPYVPRPNYDTFNPQGRQYTANFPYEYMPPYFPSPVDVHMSPIREGPISFGPIPGISNNQQNTEADNPSGDRTNETSEDKQIIRAPTIYGLCPEGMKNYNGRCRRIIGRFQIFK